MPINQIQEEDGWVPISLFRRGLQAGPVRPFLIIAIIGLLAGSGPLMALNPRGWGYPLFRDPAFPKTQVTHVLATPAYIHLWQTVFAHANPIVDTQLCQVIHIQQGAGLALPPSLTREITRVALGQWTVKPTAQNLAHWHMAQIAALKVVGRSLADHSTTQLIRLDQHGSPALAMAIDPLFFGRRSRAMTAIWLERASDNRQPVLVRCSAIEGLQANGDVKAGAVLLKICDNRRYSPMLRLAAARALAHLHVTGSGTQASSVTGGGYAGRIHAIVHAILIAGTGNASEIIHLCQSQNPAIILIGLRRIELDAAMSRQFLHFQGGKLAIRLTHIAPASIRYAVRAAALRAGDSTSLKILFSQLADARMYISDAARMAITRLARRPALHQLAISDAMACVDVPTTGANAQTQMQSMLILGRLKIQAVIAPAARLLHSRSDRVVLAAVIALRRLHASQEAAAVYHLAAGILNNEFELKKKYIKKAVKAGLPGEAQTHIPYIVPRGTQVRLQSQAMSQAFCMLGQLKYRKAIPTLVRLIPQFGPYSNRSREAAIWAIGKIDIHHPNPVIARKLLARLNDAFSLPPEVDGVRAMSAISLARMDYKPALSSIESFAQTPYAARSTYACIWAAKKLAGKVYPYPVSRRTIPRGFVRPSR